VTALAYVEEFAAFAKGDGHEGPRWLRGARKDAIKRFEKLGFPTTRDEDWHYTSVSSLADAGFRVIGAPGGEVTREQLAPYLVSAAWPTLVFVNGRHAPELSSGPALPAGITARPLSDAIADGDKELERHLTKIATDEAQAFTQLNTAYLRDGAYVHVSGDASVATPVHLLFVSDALAAGGAAHVRNVLVAERGSRASVVESYVAVGSAQYFTNAVTEVRVGDGATLGHYKVQRESARAFHVSTTEVRQGRDSHYVNFSFAAGAQLSRTNVSTVLGGEGCGVTLNGLYMVDGTQHVDHQTRVEHVEPNCFSRELYKGVLDGASHAVFNGKVYVHPEAQKTDGKQSNNNLLLSELAHVDTKPQLEIFADDVKCTHGATVGRIDETALFYMKSRGINAETARRLLTYAFAADVLETIELDPLREGLEGLTLRRFTAERAAGGAE
jgi:Fe-S cluster assembly protein SufD